MCPSSAPDGRCLLPGTPCWRMLGRDQHPWLFRSHPSACLSSQSSNRRAVCYASCPQKVSHQILLKGAAREHMMFVEGGDPLDVPVESLTVIPALDAEHREGKPPQCDFWLRERGDRDNLGEQ